MEHLRAVLRRTQYQRTGYIRLRNSSDISEQRHRHQSQTSIAKHCFKYCEHVGYHPGNWPSSAMLEPCCIQSQRRSPVWSFEQSSGPRRVQYQRRSAYWSFEQSSGLRRIVAATLIMLVLLSLRTASHPTVSATLAYLVLRASFQDRVASSISDADEAGPSSVMSFEQSSGPRRIQYQRRSAFWSFEHSQDRVAYSSSDA